MVHMCTALLVLFWVFLLYQAYAMRTVCIVLVEITSGQKLDSSKVCVQLLMRGFIL